MKNKILLFCTLLIIFTYATSIFAKDNNELANVYYQSGLSLLKQNKHDEAVEKFTKALAYRQEFPDALFKLGECYEKLGDNKNSLQNYRLCLKYLKQQKTLSKEENQLLSQVSSRLDKLDVTGKELTNITNNYINGLLALANECLNKNCQRFAYQVLQRITKIDPANKNTPGLLARIDKKLFDEPMRELFNGKDIKNWRIHGDESARPGWYMEKGTLVCDTQVSAENAFLSWNEIPPENYTVTIKFNIEDVNGDPRNTMVAIAYGKNAKDTSGLCAYGASAKLSGAAIPHQMQFTKYGNKIKLLLDGKVLDDEVARPFISPQITLCVKNLKVRFTKIVLQKLRPLAQSQGGDTKRITQSLFNGKDISNWTVADNEDSDPSKDGCWSVKQGKIIANPQKPETSNTLIWKGEPPSSYKLTMDISIGRPMEKDKSSSLSIAYGLTRTPNLKNMTLAAYSLALDDSLVQLKKLEIIRNNSHYKIIFNGKLFKEFEPENNSPAIGFLTKNLKLSITSITLEEIKE